MEVGGEGSYKRTTCARSCVCRLSSGDFSQQLLQGLSPCLDLTRHRKTRSTVVVECCFPQQFFFYISYTAVGSDDACYRRTT